ncbi:WcaI family glycosyltransferase [Chitinophaga rhizosphaerae]|uniref:WcaI family glycosyltransferase n=1 Tax=Chitinophaga rhizosphaerae TaxID=1864947 RepID=UPI000F7FAD7E|nr:WcaI family glycosyltransferase [Chitinophaga rhizosphaerae]
MPKRLLLIGGNYAPEPTGIGKFNGEMIGWLVNNGYECTVITTYPYYPQWKVQEPYARKARWFRRETSHNGKLTVYRCPQYVPANPSGKKRMMMDVTFAMAAFAQLLRILPAKKYDYVMSVVPSFHLGLLALLYKKFRGAEALYHIQDLQIDAARDLNMIRSGKMINAMLKLEKFILRESDCVSSISDGMIRQISGKLDRRIELFPNWADVDKFHPLPGRMALKEAFGFRPDDKVVLYSGAIGEKQGLESILHAAASLEDREDVQFVICGSGPYREKLHGKALSMGLKRVHFLPLQPFEQFNRFLNMADLHLVIQKSGASDLVMPSKLTAILAVGGLSLVTANPGSSLYDVVQHYQLGIIVPAENQEALNAGIRKAVSEDHAGMRGNARSYAVEYLSIDKVMGRFEANVLKN